MMINDQTLANELLAARHASGADRYDEVWEGIYMMAPMADNDHQRLVTELAIAFGEHLFLKHEKGGDIEFAITLFQEPPVMDFCHLYNREFYTLLGSHPRAYLEVLQVQHHLEAQRILSLDHGRPAVGQEPVACRTLRQCFDNPVHGKIMRLPESQGLGDGLIDPRNHDLVSRLRRLTRPDRPHVDDRPPHRFEHGRGPTQVVRTSAHHDRKCAHAGAFGPSADRTVKESSLPVSENLADGARSRCVDGRAIKDDAA